MSTIEFGIRIPNSGPLASTANMVEAARGAEDRGVDAVWVHDHLTWTLEMHRYHVSCGSVEAVREDQDPDFFESIVVLSHVAAVTKRCRLGVAALVLPARNPVHMAKQWATLDVMSGGRTTLVVGLGSPATTGSREYEAVGVPMETRGKRLDEYMGVLRTIWADGPSATFEGQFASFDQAVIFPKPLQKPVPPIWIGGGTLHAIKRAARLGDGWIPGWLTPAEMKKSRAMLVEEAAKHGRDGSKLPVGLEVITSIAKDRQTAHDRAPGAVATVKAGLGNWERKFDRTEDAVDQCIIGDVDDCIRQVEAFKEAGDTHFELRLDYQTMDELMEQLDIWSEKVQPRFR